MTTPGTTDPEHDLRDPSEEGGVAGVDRISETKSASASEETEDADFSSESGARPTREELERKYRQDPRFNMLFDHGRSSEKDPEHPKRRHVRVGGIRLTPKRIVIIAGFLLIMLSCLGACIFFLVKDLDRGFESARAIALYNAGDYDVAKDKLVRVLSRDPHRENAVAALANIYHHYGDWGNETFFRHRLVRLNPLNKQYFDDFLKSAMRARNYNVIYSQLSLKQIENETLDPEMAALYLMSALHSGHVSEGKSFYRSKVLTEPKYFTQTELGRFAETLLKAEPLVPKEADKLFAALDDVKDPAVRFELLNMRVYLLSKIQDEERDAKIEAMLIESAELNNFAGAPILANFYFSRYRFEDAIRVSEDFLKTKINTEMPVLYGESSLLSGQPELIPPMADRIRKLEGRQSRIIASYLDALTAFAAGDLAETKARLQDSGSTIETPMSSLISLILAVNSRSAAEVRLTLSRLMTRAPFLDLQERARTAALSYLLAELGDMKGFPEPRQVADYAAIADLIHTPGDDNSFLQRIIMLDKYNRNALNEDELQSMLQLFPGDLVLLRIATEYYLFRNNTKLAMDYIEQYRKDSAGSETGPDDMSVLHMLVLDQLGRQEEAEEEFRSIVERDPDNGDLLFYYYTYCTRHGFLDPLRELEKRVAALPQDSSLREFLPFIHAEIQFADGDRKAALDVFETAKTRRPDLIDYAGDFLAAGGRTDAAIKRYLSIQENTLDKVQLHLKLSRLYRAKNDLASARKHAYAAWAQDREDLDARFAYAQFLVEEKAYADAIEALKFPQYKAVFPENVVDLWSRAMREQMKSDFANARYTPAFEAAKHLLIYFPYDEEAQDYIRRVEQIRQEEKEREAARSKKKPSGS